MPFQFDKLTSKAQESIQTSQSAALEQGHPEIDSLHLLAALIGQRAGMIVPVLESISVDIAGLRQWVDKEIARFQRLSFAKH